MTADAVPRTGSESRRWPAVAETWGLDASRLPVRGADSDWRPHLRAAGGSGTGTGWADLQRPHDAQAGIGAEGLAFTAAKAAARPRAGTFQHGHLLIDAMHGITVLDGTPIPEPDPLWLRQILKHDGVLQLSVVAHGDGGHLKLPNGLVGCGLTLDEELGLRDGRPARRGCLPGVRCQRSPRIEDVVLCREMRIAHAVLMVCKAGLLTDAVHPTTNNVVLALLEGHALGVIAPAGVCAAAPVITHGLLSLPRLGDTYEVRSYLDDMSGDGAPLFRILGYPQELPLTAAPASGVAVHRVAPGSLAWWTDSGRPPRPGRDTRFGGSHLVLPAEVAPDCVTVGLPGRPLDAVGGAWRNQLDLVRLHTWQLTTALDRSDSAPAGIAGLTNARRLVEDAIGSTFERHAAAQDHGVAVRVTRPPAAVLAAVRSWQAAVADVLEPLLVVDDVIDVLAAGLWRADGDPGPDVCAGCGGGMTRATLRDPLSDLAVLRDDCRRCGPQRLMPAEPDGVVHMAVDRDAGQVHIETTGPATVLLALSYKATTLSCVDRREITGPECRLPLPAPDGRAPDTARTLRVALVAGTDLHTWKERL